MELQKEIDRKVDPARERVRNAFYEKWFATLVTAICSYFAGRILLWYFSLVRRKGLPRKTTYEIYFATNVSSFLARLLALIIVGLGLLALAINLYFALKTGEIFGNPLNYLGLLTPILGGLPFSGVIPHDAIGFGLIYGVLGPLAITLATLLSSWLWVLLSEFFCFISNVYHLLFKKVYPVEDEDSIN